MICLGRYYDSADLYASSLSPSKKVFRKFACTLHVFGEGAKMMRVFSWSGKLLHTYVFDRPLAGVFVDEARKTLWATDVNSDEQLVSYALK